MSKKNLSQRERPRDPELDGERGLRIPEYLPSERASAAPAEVSVFMSGRIRSGESGIQPGEILVRREHGMWVPKIMVDGYYVLKNDRGHTFYRSSTVIWIGIDNPEAEGGE